MASRNEWNRNKLLGVLDFAKRVMYSENDDAIDALLSKMHELTAPWANNAAGDVSSGGGAAGSVLYALDPRFQEWAAAGVPQGDVPLYLSLGFRPDLVKRWTDAGLDVGDMMWWARELDINDVDPRLVAEWRNYEGDISFGYICDWVECGMSAADAILWHAAGWSHVGSEKVKSWHHEFSGLHVDPAGLLVNVRNGHDPSETRKWVERGFVGVALEEFYSRGYTPREAEAFVEVNGVDATPPVACGSSERRTRKLAGRTWTQIWNKARSHGWHVSRFDEKQSSGGYSAIMFMHEGVAGVQLRVSLVDGKFVSAYWYTEGEPWEWTFTKSLNFRELLKELAAAPRQ